MKKDPQKQPHTLPAEITLNGSGWQGDDGEEFVELRITDKTSGCLVCEAHLTGAQLVAAISGRYLSNIPVTWYAPDTIGWTRVVERNPVRYLTAGDFDTRRVAAREAVEAKRAEIRALYPEDSQVKVSARFEDAWNGHRLVARDGDVATYTVHFSILIPPGEEYIEG